MKVTKSTVQLIMQQLFNYHLENKQMQDVPSDVQHN